MDRYIVFERIDAEGGVNVLCEESLQGASGLELVEDKDGAVHVRHHVDSTGVKDLLWPSKPKRRRRPSAAKKPPVKPPVKPPAKTAAKKSAAKGPAKKK